jgi:hypothetical protein
MVEAARLLALWQAGLGPAPGRAARILRALGEPAPETLTLGAATRRLVAHRAEVVGGPLEAVAACPACGVVNAMVVDPLAWLEVPDTPTPEVVEAAGWRLVPRLLTVADLEAAATAPDAAAFLRGRALAEASGPDGAPELPAEAVTALEVALETAEPLADAEVAFTCTACGHGWTLGFEPASFLAEELAARARRLMAEVATLARAFGWSEAEVLALPAERRRVYLDLAA